MASNTTGAPGVTTTTTIDYTYTTTSITTSALPTTSQTTPAVAPTDTTASIRPKTVQPPLVPAGSLQTPSALTTRQVLETYLHRW